MRVRAGYARVVAVPTTDNVWRERDTEPPAIEAAIRALERDRHREDPGYVHARVLNMVVLVDREWSGEIANRLGRVGRFHPSRLIVCAIDPGRRVVDALVSVAAPAEVREGETVATRETVVLDIGARHVAGLETIVGPLVKTDVPTLVWAPHGHHDAVRRLMGLAQVMLVDSVEDPDAGTALRRARGLSEETYVVDLAWLRTTPWRERIAGTFDPANRRCELSTLTRLQVRHHPDSRAAALLLTGWLASRLGWEPSPLVSGADGLQARLHAQRQDVAVHLAADPSQTVPGLSGITVDTASGETLALDRGRGGLHATIAGPGAPTQDWTLLGASRGESGVLGEGIRQALLRDPTYLPALRAAEILAR